MTAKMVLISCTRPLYHPDRMIYHILLNLQNSTNFYPLWEGKVHSIMTFVGATILRHSLEYGTNFTITPLTGKNAKCRLYGVLKNYVTCTIQ